jgi:hypothetical protein
MEKEKYLKSEDNTIFKTVVYDDGSMKPFVFQHGSNVWVNVPIGHYTQAEFYGHEIVKEEAKQIMEQQKKQIK